jgi:hypothetical protein
MSLPQRKLNIVIHDDREPFPALTQFLGPAVFIAWPKGVKGSPKRWKHLTLAHMTPEYLAKLRNGNIGVALGNVSYDLCAIDIDLNELVEPFLNANPILADTFQTHGARGRVFWIRLKGSYPIKTYNLKTLSGAKAGEFRSNGSQSIVWGIHPATKEPYQWVVRKSVVEIQLDSINWPECFDTPTFSFAEAELKSNSHRDSVAENDLQKQFCRVGFTEQSVTEASDVIGDSSCASVGEGESGTIKNLEDVLRLCVPTKVHENNNDLFKLARGILNLEKLEQHPYSPAQCLAVFDEWYKRSLPFLRPGQSRDAYLTEFMNARKHAKTPLGGNTIDEAWQLAQTEPLPPEAGMFEEERSQRLVGFCFQLQRMNGKQPFYLSSRMCQRLLGLDTAHEAAKWLTALQVMEIIEVAEKGGARRATRYRYLSRKSSPPPWEK